MQMRLFNLHTFWKRIVSHATADGLLRSAGEAYSAFGAPSFRKIARLGPWLSRF